MGVEDPAGVVDVDELELELDRVQEQRLLDRIQGDSKRHNARMQGVKDHQQDQPHQYRAVRTVDRLVTRKIGVGRKILHYVHQILLLDGVVVGEETEEEEEDAAIGVSAESGR